MTEQEREEYDRAFRKQFRINLEKRKKILRRRLMPRLIIAIITVILYLIIYKSG
jgi:hypothetical protein